MRALCLVLAVVTGGCFGPKLEGVISCEQDGLCPPGLGCFNGQCLPDEPTADASPDAPDAAPDGPPLCLSFEAVHFDACAIPEPGPALDLDGNGTYPLDTDDGTLSDPGGGDIAIVSEVIDGVRVISLDNLRIGPDARLRPVGSLPLMIASFNNIVIAGNLDIDEGGAGSNADCGVLAPARGGDNAAGGSGGGGGGFGTAGGNGGMSDSGAGMTPGGAAGQALSSPPTAPRGGCQGGEGGDGEPQSDGRGGNSGGGVQLTARLAIVVTGVVDAGGNGGIGGATAGGGGGGGGSGGYIGLEAPSIDLSGGVVVANGGGGGEGADALADGDTGTDGRETTNRAAGGSGGAVDGGDGGDGAVLGQDGETPNNTPLAGGGGGGGGVGFILTKGSVDTNGATIISPAPQPIPES